MLATTWHGILAHRLPQQSAALTYYSLMSLGPLLGLALTVSGFILSRAGEQQDNPAKRAIVAAVEYAAPQIVAKASTPDHHATLRERFRRPAGGEKARTGFGARRFGGGARIHGMKVGQGGGLRNLRPQPCPVNTVSNTNN